MEFILISNILLCMREMQKMVSVWSNEQAIRGNLSETI